MAGTAHPFQFRDFRYFWIARFCSALAQSSMIVVIGWQVYDAARLTMSVKEASLQLGIVGLLQFVPLFALTLVTGWTADYIDRRLVSRLCLSLQTVCAFILVWHSVNGATTLAPLFFVAVLLGVARAFSNPALGALAPMLVPADVLPRAIATNAIASRIGAIVGPALGGYLYVWSPAMPHIVSAAMFACAVFATIMIRPLASATPDRSRNPWAQMVEGITYVRHNRVVLGAISLDLFAVLLGGATAMLPAFAHDILKVGPAGLGHLRAAPAIGAMATAFWFSYHPLRQRAGVWMLWAVAVFGVATIVFGLSRSMALSLASLTTLGAADMFSVYVRQSLVQLSTPNEMRGRVGAVSGLFISASNELGEAESGLLAALVGPVTAVVIGGVGAIAVTGIWARLFPALRQAEALHEIPAKPA